MNTHYKTPAQYHIKITHTVKKLNLCPENDVRQFISAYKMKHNQSNHL